MTRSLTHLGRAGATPDMTQPPSTWLGGCVEGMSDQVVLMAPPVSQVAHGTFQSP